MAGVGDDEIPELAAFRAEARAWLEANVPASVRGAPYIASEAIEGGEKLPADAELWRQRIGEKGWGTPTWPRAYGGGGLSLAEAHVLQQEMARIGANNPIGGMGVMMFGPTLLEFGNEEQKQRHIPPIVRGELHWCQGYSEPGAGSDLAALQTKAEDKGDYFLVNGQKTWTSGAQFAQWCFCLVRTDPKHKHEGISFLLIDMDDPGIEVRPIKLISGASPFCETFFTDVKVPKENLVGPLNGGWAIGKRLLQHERGGLSGGGGSADRYGSGKSIEDLAKEYVGVNEDGRLADPDLRSRIIRHQMEAKTLMLTLSRAAAEAKGNAGPSAATSIMKNVDSKVGQDRAELAIEIMGAQGLGWDGDGFKDYELRQVRNWLSGKATTIYGGSTEIQNNIIAKRILGLLDHQ